MHSRRNRRSFHTMRLVPALAATMVGLAATAIAEAAPADRIEGRRAALVIGNSSYSGFPGLPNAASDARHIGELLQQANFEVMLGEDLDKQGMERIVREFLRTLNDGDVALFYYSGHAVQVSGENFIIPVDAALKSAYDLEVESYNVGHLLDYMRETSSLQIVVLDSCRDNPFKDQQLLLGDRKPGAQVKDGLAPLTARDGSLIVYSTAPDRVAYDGSGDQSPFTDAMSRHMLTPNLEVRDILTRVRSEVIDSTAGQQVPWDVSSLTSQFYFVLRQSLLILGDGLEEVRTTRSSSRIGLGLAPPIASAGLSVSARFDRVPSSGELQLDGRPLAVGESFDASRLGAVEYVGEAGDKQVELVSYTLATDGDQSVTGVVAIVFDDAAPARPATDGERIVARLDISPALEREPETSSTKSLAPVQIAMAPSLGTGFVTITDAMEETAEPMEGWLRVAARHPSTQLSLGSTLLSTGDLVRSEDVPRLAIRPSLQIDAVEDEDDEPAIVLTQASGSGEELERVVIKVEPTIHACDELAGDRLDVQGVTDGVFPNDIDVDRALEACTEAVEAFPEIARFQHQLGRALYAHGDFDQAIVRFQAALAAGHVRSGDVLGRMYQFGAGLPKEPERAIPLFEAGAERGDPYAQQSLAKAIMEENGIALDVERGLDLYGRAVEAGHTYAMNGLGAHYLYGRNVAKDEVRAHRLFKASLERNDIWGVMNMALLYRDGVVVEKDRARAMDMLRQAHEGRHPYAGRLLGLMLQEEASPDVAETMRYYRESAARGDAWSAHNAARLIQDGAASEIEDGEAVRLYGFAVGRGRGDDAAWSRRQLSQMPEESIAREVQKALVRLGADGITVDGALGQRSRDAAAGQLSGPVPADPIDLLGALLDREWIASQPRLDML